MSDSCTRTWARKKRSFEEGVLSKKSIFLRFWRIYFSSPDPHSNTFPQTCFGPGFELRMVENARLKNGHARVEKMPLHIRIQWNAVTACVSERVLETLAWGLRVGPPKGPFLHGWVELQAADPSKCPTAHGAKC